LRKVIEGEFPLRDANKPYYWHLHDGTLFAYVEGPTANPNFIFAFEFDKSIFSFLNLVFPSEQTVWGQKDWTYSIKPSSLASKVEETPKSTIVGNPALRELEEVISNVLDADPIDFKVDHYQGPQGALYKYFWDRHNSGVRIGGVAKMCFSPMKTTPSLGTGDIPENVVAFFNSEAGTKRANYDLRRAVMEVQLEGRAATDKWFQILLYLDVCNNQAGSICFRYPLALSTWDSALHQELWEKAHTQVKKLSIRTLRQATATAIEIDKAFAGLTDFTLEKGFTDIAHVQGFFLHRDMIPNAIDGRTMNLVDSVYKSGFLKLSRAQYLELCADVLFEAQGDVLNTITEDPDYVVFRYTFN
jgi:hypothetical protein